MHEIFDRIISYHDPINGDLAPEKMDANSIAKTLKNDKVDCREVTLVRFKKLKTEKDFEIIESLKVSSAHPLFREVLETSNFSFPYPMEEILNEQVISKLKISSEDISKSQYNITKTDGVYTISISKEINWTDLEENRLKYGYLNMVLNQIYTEHTKTLRDCSIRMNEIEFNTLVAKLQRILTSYLNELIEKYGLKHNDLKIKIKTRYTAKDHAVLIYRSIVNLMDFIVSTFSEFIDDSQKIPYFSKSLNENDFVNKAKKILKALKEIEVDEIFYFLMEEELEKVLNLHNSERISYKEFGYYNNLLRNLFMYLSRAKLMPIDEQQIIQFLVTINFQNQSFFDYLVNDIINAIHDFDDHEEKHLYLLQKKKEFSQVLLKIDEKDSQLVKKVIAWIDIELDFWNIYPRKDEGKTTQDESLKQQKLKTRFNSKELSTFYRVVYDLGVIEPESMSSLAQWIQASFVNEQSKDFSVKHIRNNLYNMHPSSANKIRDLAFQIINKIPTHN
ncbi:MAG: hypothetical protein JJT77_01735 [Crocinitomicaceae bacterium]|nr:hypothetical protein [Crocinitomicaceae bacterium]